MNILYFAPIRIYPTGHGNIATVRRYLERLRQNGHKVHYVFFDEQNVPSFDLFYAQNFVDTLDIVKCNGALRNRTNGYYEFDSWYQNGVGEKIAELCKIYKVDVVICTYVMYSKLLEFVPDNILKIIDTHDKMSDRHLNLIKNNIPDEFFSCTKEDEAKYLNRADIVWSRRDEETQYFNFIMGNHKTITVSHFDEPNFLKKNIDKIKTIGFLASDNNVNARMVIDFAEELLKHNEFLKTDMEVIIGGDVKKILDRNENFLKKIQHSPIKLVGRFEKLEDFYNTVDAVVVPIMFGTGINIKMIEAMSFGIPVISTKCGIKGVDSSSKYHSANSMKELLDKIVELYNNSQDLSKLTELSKSLYIKFYKKNTKIFDKCFLPKTNIEINDYGENNRIEVDPNIKFNEHSSITIEADSNNCHVIIKNTDCEALNIKIRIRHGNNQTVIIEKGFLCWDNPTEILMWEPYNKLYIGENCMSAGCQILCGDSHVIMSTKTHEIINFNKGVSIGNHCWLGKNSIILKNVNLTNDVIVGANSVVTKSVDTPFSAIGGNPAKILKTDVIWSRNNIEENEKRLFIENQEDNT